MNRNVLRKLVLWGGVFILSIFLNPFIIQLVSVYKTEWGSFFFAYLSSFVFFVAIVAVSVETIVWHNRKEFILPFLLSFFISLWVGTILKDIFAIDRPYITYHLNVLVPESGYSFPSLHTIQAFSLLPLVWYKDKKVGYFWCIFAVLIGISRMYLQVHYLSDVIFGAFLGYTISALFLRFEEKYNIFSRCNELLKTNLEIRRQLFHTLFGAFIVFLLKMCLITQDTLLILIILSFIFIILLKKFKFPYFLYTALSFFEREKHLERFPARGIFFFLIGSYITLLLFPEKIVLASILVLAIGDSVTNIIGRYFGKRTIWYNTKKQWEGTIAGICFATIGASLFVPLWVAAIAATVAMLVESWDVKIGKWELDDNISIPVVAGLVMYFLI